jgi:cholesterol transport system auxiliary component
MRTAPFLLAGAMALWGCALLGKSDPVVPRYFAPDAGEGTGARAGPSSLRLRLGRVEGWSNLRERMALRTAGREYVYREDRRWTERPEVYLRRALVHTLFEERGLVEVVSGRADTLEVELTAFEEVERPHQARLQARLLLHDDRVGLLEETVTVEVSIAKSDEAGEPQAVADAMSAALHAGVELIADRVVERLTRQALEQADR